MFIAQWIQIDITPPYPYATPPEVNYIYLIDLKPPFPMSLPLSPIPPLATPHFE